MSLTPGETANPSDADVDSFSAPGGLDSSTIDTDDVVSETSPTSTMPDLGSGWRAITRDLLDVKPLIDHDKPH